MVGGGGEAWLNINVGNGDMSLRAVPHALILPWQQHQGQQSAAQNHSSKISLTTQWRRAWYGRMFLPPVDSLIPVSKHGSSSSTPFGELRASQVRAVISQAAKDHSDEQPTLGCDFGARFSFNDTKTGTISKIEKGWVPAGPSFLRALMGDSMPTDGAACGADETLCWMQCMSNVGLTCGPGTQPECVDTSMNEVVDGSNHCPSGIENCQPLCSTPSILQESGFCVGTGTDMNMDGFNSWLAVDGDEHLCLNLLFTSWTLDSHIKVIFACLGTVILAILTEFLGKMRRTVSKMRGVQSSQHLLQKNGLPGNRKESVILSSVAIYDAVLVLMFVIQVTLGYFLMLIAMTYQAELFVCVILGLAIGHALFNLSVPPVTNTDPCCSSGGECQCEEPAESVGIVMAQSSLVPPS
jgi:hypothetical protein